MVYSFLKYNKIGLNLKKFFWREFTNNVNNMCLLFAICSLLESLPAQAGTPMAMPVNAQPPTYMVMQGQPQVIQTPQTDNNQKVIHKF